MDELRGQPRFHDVSAFFGLCGLGGSGLRCGWFRIFGARVPAALQQAVRVCMRRTRKRIPEK